MSPFHWGQLLSLGPTPYVKKTSNGSSGSLLSYSYTSNLFVLKFVGLGGNGATPYFLVFAILAGVLGVASKLVGGNHIRAWRNDSLAAAGSSAIVAWAVTALAFGLACKEIDIGFNRGWRLKVLETFTIILGCTQLVYVVLLHAGIFCSKYGPGYRDGDYGVGAGAGVDPAQKGGGVCLRV